MGKGRGCERKLTRKGIGRRICEGILQREISKRTNFSE